MGRLWNLARTGAILRRFLNPRFADDLPSLPATSIQKEVANLRHVPWTQVKTSPGLNDVIRILRPIEIRDAERLEQMALSELVCPQPGDLVDDLSECDGNSAAVGELRAGLGDQRPFEYVTDGIGAANHRDMIVARIGIGIRPLVPRQAR